jgi:hypothetical protein
VEAVFHEVKNRSAAAADLSRRSPLKADEDGGDPIKEQIQESKRQKERSFVA